MNIRLLLATLLILVSIPAVRAQTPDRAGLDRFFDRLAEKNQAMGSLTIAKDGQVLYTRAIGYSRATGDDKTPATAATRYRIGSITKMFTAVLVYQLAEEKKLNLTDRLDQFFPQIPNAPRITLAMILGHRSGLPDIVGDPGLAPLARTEPITKAALLARVAQGTPLFEPDARNLYSNAGYTVLGLIIEKVTGQTYPEVLRERITAKIGLADTSLATGAIDPGRNEALTYRNLGGWRQEAETHPSILFSAGAIISTPHDLAKFIHALFGGRLIAPEHLALMRTVRDGEAMGMEAFEFAGKTFFGHTGGADNYGAWVAYLPEEKLAFAYATNAKVYPVGNIMKGLAEIYFGRPFELPSFDAAEVAPEVLDRYVGVYAMAGAPRKMNVTRENGTLAIAPAGQSGAPLKATAPDKFVMEGTGVVFEFDAAKGQMTMKRPNGELVFIKEQ